MKFYVNTIKQNFLRTCLPVEDFLCMNRSIEFMVLVPTKTNRPKWRKSTHLIISGGQNIGLSGKSFQKNFKSQTKTLKSVKSCRKIKNICTMSKCLVRFEKLGFFGVVIELTTYPPHSTSILGLSIDTKLTRFKSLSPQNRT